IKKFYTMLFRRALAAKMSVQSVSEVRDGFRADALLTFQLAAKDGAPYEFMAPVRFAIYPDHQNRLFIGTQQGGNVPTITAVDGGAERTIAAGASDWLSVRVTNATGLPMPNVQVRFTIDSGPGSISSESVVTDGNGIAATHFTAAGDPKPSRVTAVAAVLPV